MFVQSRSLSVGQWIRGIRLKASPLSASTDRIPFIESIPLFDSTAARCDASGRPLCSFGKMEEPAASIRQKISSVEQGVPLEADDLTRIRFHCETLCLPSMKCYDQTLCDKWSERASTKHCKLDENDLLLILVFAQSLFFSAFHFKRAFGRRGRKEWGNDTSQSEEAFCVHQMTRN